MARKKLDVETVAEAYLALLAERGVEYLFANAGTDFAPIVEAYARAAHSGLAAPKPLIATHENLAMSMAHGYAAASGRVPAVMVHVSVGTANAVCGIYNAARVNVPILFTAGRSPLTEGGLPGAGVTVARYFRIVYTSPISGVGMSHSCVRNRTRVPRSDTRHSKNAHASIAVSNH